MVLERRAVRVVAAERRRRLRAPGREARRDAAAHEVVEPLGRRRDRLVDRLEAERLRHLDARDEVRDHVARAEDLGRVEDPPVPLLAADVALLAGRDHREEPLVPDLVVRVVDRDAVVLEALHVGLRQRLRDDLADPAAREALLDRLRVAAVEVRLREPVDRRGDRAAGERVRVARAVVVAVDQRERLEHVLDRLHAGVRPAGLLVLAPVVVDVAEAALLLARRSTGRGAARSGRSGSPTRSSARSPSPSCRSRACGGSTRASAAASTSASSRPSSESRRPPVAARDAVRRVGVDAHRDDRPAQLPRPAGERDLLRRPPQCRRAELGQRLLVEREDEVRLRLDLAVEVVGQRRRRRTRSRCAAGPPSAPPPAGSPGSARSAPRRARCACRRLRSRLEPTSPCGLGAALRKLHRSPLDGSGGLRYRGAGSCSAESSSEPCWHASRRRAFAVGARRYAGAHAERELPAHGAVHRARARRPARAHRAAPRRALPAQAAALERGDPRHASASPRWRRTSRRTATVAGVNGDLFNWNDGHPSGMVMQDSVLHEPAVPRALERRHRVRRQAERRARRPSSATGRASASAGR